MALVATVALTCSACEKVGALKARAVAANPAIKAEQRLKLELSTAEFCQYGDYDVVEASLLDNRRHLQLTIESLDAAAGAPLSSQVVKLSDFDGGRIVEVDMKKLGDVKDVGIFLCSTIPGKPRSCAKSRPARFDQTEKIAKEGGPDADSLFYFQYLKVAGDRIEFLNLQQDEAAIISQLRDLTRRGNAEAHAATILERTLKFLKLVGSVGIEVGGTTASPSAQISLLKHSPTNCATTKSAVKKVREPREAMKVNHAKKTKDLWKLIPKVDLK